MATTVGYRGTRPHRIDVMLAAHNAHYVLVMELLTVRSAPMMGCLITTLYSTLPSAVPTVHPVNTLVQTAPMNA